MSEKSPTLIFNYVNLHNTIETFNLLLLEATVNLFDKDGLRR